LMRCETRVFAWLSKTSPRRSTPASDSMLSAAAAPLRGIGVVR
jgi:hypothetical protein